MRSGVLVFHPGRQHAHQAALALERYSLLASFTTGLPCLARHAVWLPRPLRGAFLRQGVISLPEERVKFRPLPLILRKSGQAFLPGKWARALEYFGYACFDSAAARTLSNASVAAVLGYENSSLQTFRVAKKLGVLTILDAASLHHSAQDHLGGARTREASTARIRNQKDEEIRLADLILTCSDLARQTYLEVGVAPEKVISLPLGVDLDVFTPGSGPGPPDSHFVFLYAGNLSFHKGLDILLEAFLEVRRERADAVLRIAGNGGDTQDMLRNPALEGVEWLGRLAQPALTEQMRQAHCLVLPSRMDSFGLVVAEALACGTPVIVSTMTGAKDLVREGENGWITPVGEVSPLAQRMRWCIDHRNEVLQMRRRARELIQDSSWETYGRRLKDILVQRLQTPDQGGLP